jgi:hypothetical protein
VPKVSGQADTSMIDQMFTREDIQETYVDPKAMLQELEKSQVKNTHFDNFTYDKESIMRTK